MMSSMQAFLRDKQTLREQLARKPIAEKLRILDQLRIRELSIREGARQPREAGGGGPVSRARSTEQPR